MLQPGDHVGEFELMAEIGRGAMGTVWEARQPTLSRTVAIKFLKGAQADDTWIARFEAEAAQAARLSHPGILPVYAFGHHEGTPWFAMERVDGADLDDLLKADGPFPPDRAAELVRDAARALDHAHEHGIVHRDVKPANILLRRDGRVALTDFGLSKELGSNALTTTGLLVGTPYYISPEAISGARSAVGPKADVYALGVTLFELVVGRPPFEADSALALIQMISHEDPPALRSVLPGAPKELDTLIAAAMAKDPERRPASAGALADELDRYLSGTQIETRPRTARERVARSVDRHRLPLGIGIAAVVIVLGLAAWFLPQLGDREEQIAAKDAELADLESALDQAAAIRAGMQGDAKAQRSARKSLADVVHIMTRRIMGLSTTAAIPAAVRARWQSDTPVTLTVTTSPADATVEVLHLPDGGAWEPLSTFVPRPGFYRFLARAPGRHPTIWTAIVPPGSGAAFTIELPGTTAATKDMLFYAGFWSTPPGNPGAATLEPVERLKPYLLDARAVSAADYSAWYMRLSKDERDRMPPTGTPSRAGRGRRGGRRPGGGLRGAMRALGPVQVEAYAKAHGARLPSDAELHHAYLTAALAKWLAKDTGEATDQVVQRLAGHEGIEGSGHAAEWVRGEDGRAQPEPLQHGRTARGAKRETEAALRLAR